MARRKARPVIKRTKKGAYVRSKAGRKYWRPSKRKAHRRRKR